MDGDLRERVGKVETRVDGLERLREQDGSANTAAHAEIWSSVNRIRERPPVWATAAISLLTFALGVAITLASRR